MTQKKKLAEGRNWSKLEALFRGYWLAVNFVERLVFDVHLA